MPVKNPRKAGLPSTVRRMTFVGDPAAGGDQLLKEGDLRRHAKGTARSAGPNYAANCERRKRQSYPGK